MGHLGRLGNARASSNKVVRQGANKRVPHGAVQGWNRGTLGAQQQRTARPAADAILQEALSDRCSHACRTVLGPLTTACAARPWAGRHGRSLCTLASSSAAAPAAPWVLAAGVAGVLPAGKQPRLRPGLARFQALSADRPTSKEPQRHQ